MPPANPLLLILSSLMLAACSYAAKPPVMPAGSHFRVIPAKISQTVEEQGAGKLRYRGGIGLQSRDRLFGRYSGLHISPDLTQLTAVGWGGWLTGRLSYDSSGNLTGFTNKREHPLTGLSGQPLAIKNDWDAESLLFDGQHYYVGFEINNRIWRYQHINKTPEAVKLPAQAMADVPAWGGFSSLTKTRDGALLTLTEGGQDAKGNTKGWLWSADNSGNVIWLRASKDWLPVDLALLPDGDLLLAETWRKGTVKGFHNRLSRIRQSEIKAGNIMQTELIAAFQPPDYYKKIEGVYAARGPAGETLIFTIADTYNHWPTDVMMFELTKP